MPVTQPFQKVAVTMDPFWMAAVGIDRSPNAAGKSKHGRARRSQPQGTRMKAALLGLGAAVMTTACSTVGVRSGTEEPAWREIERIGELQVRTYESRIAAQTTVTGDSEAARNAGFRKLAAYIFGANAGRTSIAMTAPVAQAAGDAAGGPSQTIAMTAPVAQTASGSGRWTIQFFMPAEWTLESLPVPRDPAVRLVSVPAETFAVLRFNGVGSVRAVDARKAELIAGVTGSDWSAVGEPVAWFYDPPWSIPALRRNEVAVRVERR